MRVLSGIQPSGGLHLGNYFGMMKPVLEAQREHELFCFIVNYHALTSERNGAALKQRTLDAACDFLALGLDTDKSVFWVQSDVPEVTELTWVLSTVTGMGILERCHSYKDKIASGLKPNHGLFAYPVLMTADILIMQGERIPVGVDQKQHLEVSRDIAQRFNSEYGKTFVVPEPDIQTGGNMLPGTDGRKMSKVYRNTIEIFSSKDALLGKVMSFKTDSTPVGQAKDVSQNNLYCLYSFFIKGSEQARLEERFKKPGLKYSEVKKELVDVIWNYFKPYRKEREALAKDPRKVMDLLKKGAKKAHAVADATMKDVRRKVGIAYGS